MNTEDDMIKLSPRLRIANKVSKPFDEIEFEMFGLTDSEPAYSTHLTQDECIDVIYHLLQISNIKMVVKATSKDDEL